MKIDILRTTLEIFYLKNWCVPFEYQSKSLKETECSNCEGRIKKRELKNFTDQFFKRNVKNVMKN
jgi:hypothetical protein